MMRGFFFAIALLACSPHHELPAHVRDTGAVEDTAEAGFPYPEGPYGGEPGQTFPDFTFAGYHANNPEWGSISLHDYWDPDHAKGIRVVVVISSVVWCPVCRDLARNLKDTRAIYEPRGVRFLHVLRESEQPVSATKKDADLWRATYGSAFDNVIDPKGETFNLQDPGFRVQPYVFVVNAQDMTVYGTIAGGWIGTKIVPVDKLLGD